MYVKGIVAIIIFYFLGRVAIAGTCETLNGMHVKEKLCWNDKVEAWVSESCTTKKCDALAFMMKDQSSVKLPKNIGSRNPASLYCHQIKHKVVILRDSKNNEQSFCQFGDSSLIDVNALERKIGE